ncbi:MAG: 1-acyl-sn-glycerol-3-phosphate acyltransferase [Anaerolineae bacterium]|nr:1-acyl-sn-glycerol-3-phosphate acyltransferase [Anaerolineae bacterium]
MVKFIKPFIRPKRYWLYPIMVTLVRFIASFLVRLEVRGLERIPASGPIAMIGNHVNFLDPVLAYIIHRRYVRGMTASENFRRFLFNFFAWAVDAIPVDRGTPDLSAIHACLDVLENGWALYIAPEGTRNNSGKTQRGLAGVTLILLRAGVHIPIYPVAFEGVEDFWPHLKRLRRAPIHITIGEPFYIASPAGETPPGGHARQTLRQAITDEMMVQIVKLLPPKNRGVYADQVDQTPRYLRFEPPGS